MQGGTFCLAWETVITLVSEITLLSLTDMRKQAYRSNSAVTLAHKQCSSHIFCWSFRALL